MTRPLHDLARSPAARDLLRAWEREGRSALELVEAVVGELGYEETGLAEHLARRARGRWACGACGHEASAHIAGRAHCAECMFGDSCCPGFRPQGPHP